MILYYLKYLHPIYHISIFLCQSTLYGIAFFFLRKIAIYNVALKLGRMYVHYSYFYFFFLLKHCTFKVECYNINKNILKTILTTLKLYKSISLKKLLSLNLCSIGHCTFGNLDGETLLRSY